MSEAAQRQSLSPPATRRWRKPLAGLVLIAAAAAGAQWYFNRPAPAAPVAQAPAAVPVIAAPATTRDMPVWLPGIGTVTPVNRVDVKVRVDGQLQSVAFTEGQEVSAGQLLAQIDPRPYQAVLAQAQATRERSLAQLANARQEVARAGKLASAGAGTSQSLDTVRAQQAALAATIEGDQASVDAAKLNLEFTRVLAPFAGRVGARQVDPGAIVRASDAAGLATITQMEPIMVSFSLPQDQLAAVRAGQTKGPLAVSIESRDGLRHIADGELVFINSTVDQTNGEIQLKASFANQGRALWPGEFVTARVLARTDVGATVVPTRAIQTGEAGLYVYIVKPDDTVVAQPVTLGPVVDRSTSIRTGVAPGDRVVLDGHFRIKPGTRVTVKPPAATP